MDPVTTGFREIQFGDVNMANVTTIVATKICNSSHDLPRNDHKIILHFGDLTANLQNFVIKKHCLVIVSFCRRRA